jgi:hypothetical protein
MSLVVELSLGAIRTTGSTVSTYAPDSLRSAKLKGRTPSTATNRYQKVPSVLLVGCEETNGTREVFRRSLTWNPRVIGLRHKGKVGQYVIVS